MSIEDPREQILARLLELMTEQYIAARTAVRNRALTKNDERPAIAILDGDETPRLTGDQLGRGLHGRPGMPFQRMTMSPQVFIIPQNANLLAVDEEAASSPTVGTLVNELRLTIVRVIAQDPVLQDILGGDGTIAYMGMTTDLKSGMRLDGQAQLDFAFTYLLDPS